MKKRLLAMTLALHLTTAAAANKHPLEYPLRDYGLLLGVALLGGLVSWSAKVRGGKAKAWGLTQLIGELTTSAFAGLLVFWLMEWASAPLLLTVSTVGVAGHMGARAIDLLERAGEKRFKRFSGLLNDDTAPVPMDDQPEGPR